MSPLTGTSRVLWTFGFALWALMLPASLGLMLDTRLLDGVNLWAKPLKFLASVGLFAVTSSLALRQVAEPAQQGKLAWGLVGLILATSVFELTYIGWQAAQGEASHFNIADPFHAGMYTLMGIGAVLLTFTSGPLAWLVARHPRHALPHTQRLAWTLGLALTVPLGIFTGAAMSGQPGHFVGHPPGGATLPLVGWSLAAGDYRVAHFLGIHTQQVLPLAGLLLARSTRGVWGVSLLGALWSGLTIACFYQADHGLPFFAW